MANDRVFFGSCYRRTFFWLLNFSTIIVSCTPKMVKLLPLGDSITHGYLEPSQHHSWRTFLRERLESEGFTEIEFVGSIFDAGAHEGRNGWTAVRFSSLAIFSKLWFAA